jgi:hypothetical protein
MAKLNSGTRIYGNVTVDTFVTATGNVTGGNILTVGLISATGNITGGNIVGIIAATSVSTAGNVTGGNILTVGLISATGNITGGNILGGANVNATTHTGTTVSVTANITGGNIITGGLISATGNITGANLLVNNDATITGNLIVNGNTTFINSNAVTTNDKSITLANNQSTAANVDGSGIDIGSTTIAYWRFNNATTSWQSNVALTPAANATLALGGTSNYWGSAFINAMNIATTSTIVGNVTGGNILTAGLISATGNITGGNILGGANVNATTHTGTTVSVTANITGGNLLTGGIVSSAGNIIGATDLYIGNGASTTAFTNPIAIFKDNGTGYVQVAVVNGTSTASADLVTYGNNGDDNQSWMDMGFNGNAFSDTNYTITGAGDGYILAQGNASFGGNMVLATGNTGTTRDIVFSFGFLAANEFVRFQRSTNTILPAANTTANIGNTARYFNNLYAVSHIGTVITATGNVTGGNILTGGLISATGNITGGNITTAGVLLVNTGNTVQAIVNGAANGVGNIGSSTTYFNTVFAKATSAQYADLAEMYVADADYPPGTVLEFGGNHEVTISNTTASALVAGVVSTNPAHLMNSTAQGEHLAAIALVGRVPTQVIGPVSKGAMMVSAGNGYAQACAAPAMGTVIGKAVEDFAGESGTIEIVVGRL